jgi:hypothetical protein
VCPFLYIYFSRNLHVTKEKDKNESNSSARLRNCPTLPRVGSNENLAARNNNTSQQWYGEGERQVVTVPLSIKLHQINISYWQKRKAWKRTWDNRKQRSSRKPPPFRVVSLYRYTSFIATTPSFSCPFQSPFLLLTDQKCWNTWDTGIFLSPRLRDSPNFLPKQKKMKKLRWIINKEKKMKNGGGMIIVNNRCDSELDESEPQ